LICVFGANENMDRDQLPALGRVAGSLADLAVITTNGPRCEGGRDFSRDIVGGFADPRRAHVILDRAAAIAWALDEAHDGDTVVLAGMGDRLYPHANSNELPWDDGDVARYVLTGAPDSLAPHRIAA
jgi:UDP-N-acetylmuramoyl-L-alanyl-D-glutamate--2,6-diaminopimelate ligase